MSQGNVKLVREIFEAGGADSGEAVLPYVPADVVWHPPPDWIEDSDYRGHDGVREAMGVFTDTFDEYRANRTMPGTRGGPSRRPRLAERGDQGQP